MAVPGFTDDEPYISEHARARMQQRRVSPQLLSLVYGHSDITKPAQEGCIRLAVSQPRLRALAAKGLAGQLVQDAAGVVIVLHAETDTVVTVYRIPDAQRHAWGRGHGRRQIRRFALQVATH